MFDAIWTFWEWISSGFCDPEYDTNGDRDPLDRAGGDDGGDNVFLLDQDGGSFPCNTIQDIWKASMLSGQLKLQKFAVDQSTVEYLMQETLQLSTPDRLQEIMLFWCTFHLTDGTAEGLVDFIQANTETLTAFRFWKTRHEETIPNEILWLLLTKTFVDGGGSAFKTGKYQQQAAMALQALEVSYFDLRQRHLSQALANLFTKQQNGGGGCLSLSHIDISYCKTNFDFFSRFLPALKQHAPLETLCLSGTGIDDQTAKYLCSELGDTAACCCCCRLKRLHLSHNHLTSASLTALATLLGQQPQLEELYLQENQSLLARCSSSKSSFTQILQVFCQALAGSSSLQTLNLARTGLSSNATPNVAEILFREAIPNMASLHTLDLSHNPKLFMDHSNNKKNHLEWPKSLIRCQNVQYLTLPQHWRSDTRQWQILQSLLLQGNAWLLELKFDQAQESPADTMPLELQAWLRRNQLLCAARTSLQQSQLPVCLWPTVLVRLHDHGAAGSSTSVYGFLQTSLVG